MKGGSSWYCMTKACIQPAHGPSVGSPMACQRASTSHSSHHPIASSTLHAPMENSNR